MNLIETGKIVNTHGVRGELKVTPWTDDPAVFTTFKTLYIDNAPYPVRSARFQGQNVLLKLDGVNDMTAAEGLKNKIIFADHTAKYDPLAPVLQARGVSLFCFFSCGDLPLFKFEIFVQLFHSIYLFKIIVRKIKAYSSSININVYPIY